MTQASYHHSYVLASAGLLVVALKARWHLLMPLWTTGMICDLLFGQVNGRRMQAVHFAGGCLSSQSESPADIREPVYRHFCSFSCWYRHLLSYLFLAETERKAAKQVTQQIHMQFSTRLLEFVTLDITCGLLSCNVRKEGRNERKT